VAEKPNQKQLLDGIETKNTRISAILQEAGDNELSDSQKNELDGLEKGIEAIEKDLAPLIEKEERNRKVKERQALIQKMRLPLNFPGSAEALNQLKSLGAQFTTSDDYTNWVKSVQFDGTVPERVKLDAPPIRFNGIQKAFETNRKAAIINSADTSGGALMDYTRTGTVVEGMMQVLTVRDLLTVVPLTVGKDIRYARMHQFLNNADVVPESNVSKFTGAVGQVEGRAPESSLTMEIIEDHVRTISHFMTESNQVIADAPQMGSLVDQFLLYGLKEKAEGWYIAGNGLNGRFTGIINTPEILEQPFVNDILTTLRKAITKITSIGRVQPTAILMHPEDWEKIDLLKDANERFYFGGPSVLGNPRIWGLPVVLSQSVPVGKAIVACWKYGVVYDREDGSITATNSHEDYFARQLVAVLGSCREGFGVKYTKAFCVCDLTDD
jgi:HK97 family phage major capsid protein